MGYIRNKTKTNRRAKRTKTNKRNARKQTFRKSRRVNRGGKGPEKRSRGDEGYENVKRIRNNSPATMEEKMISNKENNDNNRHHQEQLEQYRKQDAENAKKELYNKTKGSYREPLYPNANDVRVDQSTQLENINRQYKFNDLMDAADPDRLEFGGKKQRAIKRK
jgi:hypothetical protein